MKKTGISQSSKKIALFFGILMFAVFGADANPKAGKSSQEKEVYRTPEPCGVRAKMKDGEFSSIRACGEAALASSRSTSVRRAKKRAYMRARARMAQFLSQEIGSKETMESIAKTMEAEGAVGEASVTTQVEEIQINAKALLKGVVLIGEDVLLDQKLVRVWSGINLKTMKAADSLKYNTEKDHAAEERAKDKNKGKFGSQDSSYPTRTRSSDFDDF